tara:strand:+ start:143 stop:595 length:453 start_codon:yes stop_codon:yes gene_type:complete
MKQIETQKQRSFEMNGGYFINGVAYMDCKITGEPVKNVSMDAKSVIGSRAFMAKMDKMFPEKPKRVKTGRPSGWHFMGEFVDKDGTVYHKGVEQPKLFGTLPATKVKAKKKMKRRTKEQILIDRHSEKKAALKKEFQKQKEFLSHNLLEN